MVAVIPQHKLGIFRILLPFMEGFNDRGSATRDSATADFYISYIRQNVRKHVNADIQCKPTSGTQKMLSHPPLPIGSTSGTDWGDSTLICGSTGWVMSASDVYRLLLFLANDAADVLLTAAQKQQMKSNCLGWDCALPNLPPYPNKNGILDGSGTTPWLYTYAGIVKGSVPVVVIVKLERAGQHHGGCRHCLQQRRSSASVTAEPS